MAEMPDHITITVDETALRKQVQGIIRSEVREAAMSLRRAAEALDPGWFAEQEAWMEQHLRQRWEKERAPVPDDPGGTS